MFLPLMSMANLTGSGSLPAYVNNNIYYIKVLGIDRCFFVLYNSLLLCQL